jgi:hypothetical protein
MAKGISLSPAERITRASFALRGHRVFPEYFRFQMNASEQAASRSQFVISKRAWRQNLNLPLCTFTARSEPVAICDRFHPAGMS